MAQSLHVQGGRQGGGAFGVAQGDVEITNRSATSCRLDEPQSVAILTASRGALPVQFRSGTAHQPAVTIPPNRSAFLILDWSNWCRTNPGPLRIALMMPASGAPISGPFNGPPDYNFVPGCVARQQASTMELTALSLES
jgi:Protein of unknown function (DUF4232)